jgi:hypothetical protein
LEVQPLQLRFQNSYVFYVPQSLQQGLQDQWLLFSEEVHEVHRLDLGELQEGHYQALVYGWPPVTWRISCSLNLQTLAQLKKL